MKNDNVESIFPLSPMQQAVLIHTLRFGGSDQGLLQLHAVLDGDLDVASFKRAWDRLLERHGLLRATVHWENVKKPLQVVRKDVSLPWREEDWSGTPPDSQDERWRALIEEDRGPGLDLRRPPVMRCALVRCGPSRHRFLWTCHHIFQDGWSGSLALREVFGIYEALSHGREPELGPTRSFRDYVSWLAARDESSAESFWTKALADLGQPSELPFLRRAAPAAGGLHVKEVRRVLSGELAAALQAFGRERHLTLNTLVQGAWALFLARQTGKTDVVFGTTVSGRPPELDGSESIVGLFTNVLPVRVQLRPDTRAASWLHEIQDQQIEVRQFEHTPLPQIQEWSRLPARVPMFESLLVFETYGWEGRSGSGARSVAIRDFCGAVSTNTPVTLSASLDEAFSLLLNYDAQRLSDDRAARIVSDVEGLLAELMQKADSALGELGTGVQPIHEEAPGEPATLTAGPPARSEDDLAPPTTKTERLLADIWSEVLGLPAISIYDNFFDIGGDSMSSMRVVDRIEKAMGVAINPGEVVYQTLGQLAASLDERHEKAQRTQKTAPDKAPSLLQRIRGTLKV